MWFLVIFAYFLLQWFGYLKLEILTFGAWFWCVCVCLATKLWFLIIIGYGCLLQFSLFDFELFGDGFIWFYVMFGFKCYWILFFGGLKNFLVVISARQVWFDVSKDLSHNFGVGYHKLLLFCCNLVDFEVFGPLVNFAILCDLEHCLVTFEFWYLWSTIWYVWCLSSLI